MISDHHTTGFQGTIILFRRKCESVGFEELAPDA